MSAKLAKRVLESDLPRDVKPTAAVMTLFGDHSGECICPSIDRVAFMLSTSRATVERALRYLRKVGVFEPFGSSRGGRLPGGRYGRPVLYRLNVDALPHREPFQPRHQRRAYQPLNHVMGDVAGDAASTSNELSTTSSAPLTTSNRAVNPVTGDARSYLIVQKDRIETIEDQNLRADARLSLSENENPKTQEPEERKELSQEERIQKILGGLSDVHPKLAEQWKRDRKRRQATQTIEVV